MTKDYVWDEIDGTLLATIEAGKVHRLTDNRQIGTFREGNFHTMDGKLLGHFTIPNGSKEPVPADFLKLARETDS